MKRWFRLALALMLAALVAMGAMAEEALAPEVELGEELALNLPEDEAAEMDAEQPDEAMSQEEDAPEEIAEEEILVGEGFLSYGELPVEVEYAEEAILPEEAPEEDAPALAADEPSGVVIVNPIETLGVKENCTFRAEFANGEALGAGCVWSSDKTSVLRVVDAASGEFRGVKKGTANVTVTSAGGQTATAAVRVQAAPSKVTLSAKKGTLGAGETVQLTAKLPKNTASRISWESNNESVATVDSNGLVTAMSAGSAKITAQTFNKKKATYSLTVKAAPAGIDIPASIALGVGQKYTLNVALSPANAAGKLRVVNSDETVVQLDKRELSAANSASVKLTASTVGNATLRFESYNGVSATCEVSVYAMPTLVNITNAVTLGMGETYQLLAESNSDEALLAQCKWKTSNKKVLQIDSTGKLTAKKKGTAKITATLPSGSKTVSKSVTIRVADAPKGIALNSTRADLRIGGKLQLAATLSPAKSASQISWTSSNEAVAQVDSNGNITATGSGEATITAQTFNDHSATCVVTVASADAPEIRINGAATTGEIPEVSDSVTLSWSSPLAAQSYNVEVTAEDGTVILALQSTSETSATIAKALMTSGAIYTVSVAANGASRRAQFKYIEPGAGKGSTLIVYFSATGTTKKLARYAADILDADIYEIVPEQPYTKEDLAYYTDCRADREQADPNARPAIAGKVAGMEAYDTIVLGYPIWHGEAPRIISTFLESYDFAGKTVLPFCTSASSGIGLSDAHLHPLAEKANWLEGRRFPGSTTKKQIETWLNQVLN